MAEEIMTAEILDAHESNSIDLEAQVSNTDELSKQRELAAATERRFFEALMKGNIRQIVQFGSENHNLLLDRLNDMQQTALIIAATTSSAKLGFIILDLICKKEADLEKEMVLMTDINGDNSVHHALRNGHTRLALRLIQSHPEVSAQVNHKSESLLYMACWCGYTYVFEMLLRIPQSARTTPTRKSLLLTSIIAGKLDIFEAMILQYPESIQHDDRFEALMYAIRSDEPNIVRMLLRHYRDLSFIIGKDGCSPFSCAAEEGNVNIGKLVINYELSAAFLLDKNRRNALHIAIDQGHTDFVKFILRTPELKGLLNQADDSGRTPLHLAAEKCRPRIVRELLKNSQFNYFSVDRKGSTALDLAYFSTDHQMREFNWSEVITLLSDASCPLTAPYDVRRKAKKKFIESIREQANKDIGTYRSSTSTVGILITTVTFATAFTLPGGYIADAGPTEGLPVFSRKAAFQAFLIFDTFAMCASLLAAFICSMYRLSDIDFVLHYATKIGYLMWFAYSTMVVAFATGLYTVLAPTNLWISIFVCILCCVLPFLSYFFVEWPMLKLDRQVRGVLKIDLKEVL